MERLSWLLLLAALSFRQALCQNNSLQDGDSGKATPIWGLSREIHGGQSQLCNKTFADANATGIYYINPNVAQGPQAGQTANYNGSTLNSGLAATIYMPDWNNTASANNGTSSSYSLWYNANGANLTNDYALGYDICALAGYSFNYNTQLRGQSDNGSCLSTLDQPCISAIKAYVEQYAKWLTTPSAETPSNLTNTSLPGICRTLSHALVENMPNECSYFFQEKLDGLAWPLTAYGDSFETGLYDECTLNGTWVNALSFFNNASESIYTSWVHSVTPLIFVWMPVADAKAQTVITETVAEVFCGHIDGVSAGSFDPGAAPSPTPVAYNVTSSSNNATAGGSANNSENSGGGSGLSGGAIAGIVVGVVGAFVIAGLVFWFLRRRRRQRSLQGSQEHAIAEKSGEGRTELPGEDGTTQLPANTTEGAKGPAAQLDSNELRELDGGEMTELEAKEKVKSKQQTEPVELPAP